MVRAAVVRDGRTAVLEVEINPGRSNRARVNRSPLPRAREVVGLVRTVRLLPRGPGPGQGRPVGPAPLPRRPAGAAHAAAGRRPLRLRPDPQAAQLAAQDRRRRAPRLVEPGGRALDARGVGRPPRAHRRRAARRAARAGRGAAALRRQGVRDRRPRRDPRRRRRRVPAVLRPRGPDPARASSTEALLAEVERRRKDELDRGISLVGPHRDELLLSLGTARTRTAAGQGLRLATASRGRSRWRCGWRPTTCCAPTATTRC